jgi:hypothetical protein
MDAFRLAKLAELVLLPNRVATLWIGVPRIQNLN